MDNLIQDISEKKFKEAKHVLDERISDVVSRKLFEVKKSILAKISEAEVPIPRASPIPTPNQTNAAKGALRKELGIQKIIKDQGNQPSNWKEKTGGELPANPPRNPTLRQSKVERFAEETRAEKYAAKKAEWEAKEKPYKKEKMSDKRLEALKAKLGITTKKFSDDMKAKVAKIGQHAYGSLEETYVIKHKKTKEVLSRHDDYDKAKDEHNGLGKGKENYGVYKTRKVDSSLRNRNKGSAGGWAENMSESTDYMKRRKSMDAMPKLVRPKPTKVDAAKTDYMKRRKAMSEEELQEASFKIVKARVRGGKIQRRKKVSTRPGYTFRGGKLVRMSPAERRKRKMGARRGKIKRRSKMNRANMKRARSNRKRNALGLNRKPGKR